MAPVMHDTKAPYVWEEMSIRLDYVFQGTAYPVLGQSSMVRISLPSDMLSNKQTGSQKLLFSFLHCNMY